MTQRSFPWLNVLLIDDSQSILNFVTTVLEDKYDIENIYQATSSIEAIQILEKSKNFNLLFIDLNMPNMDGIQLLKRIQELNYQGYIAIMSGVATRVISSVELLAQEYQLNYIGTLLKPLHESDFEKIFKKIGQSRTRPTCAESLKTYEIIRAIKNDDFKVLYQPQVSLHDNKFIGVEALCRLSHPRLGMVAPNRFIDKAEESELIFHITIAVLKQAFTDWHKWQKMGLDIILSVNVSPVSMQEPQFADNILVLLKQFKMPPEKLCIEITENILANDQQQELSNMSRLSMHGIKIALDDFGKQHATVDRLRKLPINCVKLDKSYFLEKSDTNNQMNLLTTSIALAERLHLSICAEGIETKEIMELACHLKCDIAQGYFISRPIPAKNIIPWSQHWQQQT